MSSSSHLSLSMHSIPEAPLAFSRSQFLSHGCKRNRTHDTKHGSAYHESVNGTSKGAFRLTLSSGHVIASIRSSSFSSLAPCSGRPGDCEELQYHASSMRMIGVAIPLGSPRVRTTFTLVDMARQLVDEVALSKERCRNMQDRDCGQGKSIWITCKRKEADLILYAWGLARNTRNPG